VFATGSTDCCCSSRTLKPAVKTLAAETDACLSRLHVDPNQQLATSSGVPAVHTLVVFGSGVLVEEVDLQGDEWVQLLIERYAE
jgi:thioredoxin 1